MPVALIALSILWFGLIAYAVLGGADFGAGIWDLFAFGPQAQRQRRHGQQQDEQAKRIREFLLALLRIDAVEQSVRDGRPLTADQARLVPILPTADATKAADVRSGLAALGIPVFMEKAPTDLNGAYAEMLLVGKMTGRTKEAQVLVVGMKKKIAAIIAKAKITKPIRFFHELDNGLYSVTSETFIGQVYKQIAPKSVNIADAAATADSYGYPQLSAEYLVSSNPQVIFLADAQYGEDAKTVAARAGYSALDAVKNGNVVALPADVPSRWGPRLVNLYSVIAAAMAKVK